MSTTTIDAGAPGGDRSTMLQVNVENIDATFQRAVTARVDPRRNSNPPADAPMVATS